MQNFGKFRKITAEKTEKADYKTALKRNLNKTKTNAYLILLAKHRTEVQKIKNNDERK